MSWSDCYLLWQHGIMQKVNQTRCTMSFMGWFVLDIHIWYLLELFYIAIYHTVTYLLWESTHKHTVSSQFTHITCSKLPCLIHCYITLLHTCCGNPLISTLFLANSHILHVVSFQTFAISHCYIPVVGIRS